MKFPVHGWLVMSLTQQCGHEIRLENVTALAIGIDTTRFLVKLCELVEEKVNPFIIQPLHQGKK